MSNSIAPGSSAAVNVNVTALTTNLNVPVTYKTIILKKNLVNGVNTLTQAMINQANIKYVIKYDYILGEDITIPDNCILEFDGGSISASGSNDTITSANTGIQAGLVKIFNTDVILAGSWNVTEAYPEWFGAKGDGITDDTISIQKTIDYFDKISFLDKTYLVNTIDSNNVCITIPQNKVIIGHRNGHIAENEKQTIKCTNNAVKTIFLLNGHCELRDMSFGLPSSGTTINDPISSYNAAIRSTFTWDIKLYNLKTDGGDIGFDINAFMTQIIGCHSYHNKIGFYIHGNLNSSEVITVEQTSVLMSNCYAMLSRINAFRIIGLTYSHFVCLAADACGHDISQPVNSYSDIEAPYYFSYCKCCNLFNSGAEVSLKFIKTLSCSNLTIENNRFVYGYHTQQMTGGTYTPARLYEFLYGGASVNGIEMLFGGVDTESLRNAVTENSPLVYVEGNATEVIAFTFHKFASYTQITTGGYINKDKNILIVPDKKWIDKRSLNSGTLTDFIKNIPFYDYSLENTNITIDASNREAGAYTANTIDLHGKVLVIRKGTYDTITFYGQNRPITFANGKVIFIGLMLIASGWTGNTTYVFKLDNCDVEFYNCDIQFTSVQAILQAVQGYEFAKLVNTTYGDRTLITNNNSVEINSNS